MQWMMVQKTLAGPMFGQYVHFNAPPAPAVDDLWAKTTQFDKADAEAKDRLFGRGRYAD